MIAADNFYAFRTACGKGHQGIAKWLLTQSPDNKEQMIAYGNFDAFRTCARGHQAIASWLIEQSTACFAYAESHDQEYGETIIYPWVANQLTILRETKVQFNEQSPTDVFNLTDEENEAKRGFYLLRNLIRRNEATLNEDISFLLDIPAIKALVHTEVTPNQANELVRLALSVNNQWAAERLLAIPAVYALAEANNFYQNEQQGQLNLRDLAANRESAMTALTQGEQKRLARAVAHYQADLTDPNRDIMMELRTTLVTRYEARPATVQRDDGTVLVLPLSYHDFLALNLSRDSNAPQTESEYTRALTAYYQHKDHSAWRYVSKPNHWMSPNAGYVNVNLNNLAERWSTFEEYIPVIKLMYLAAIDTQFSQANDPYFNYEGMTPDLRLTHFIDELAHINRAHNWDKIRNRLDGLGTEEFDDLDGDKPSCFSGVNRRLVQSIIGHPLFSLLTLDTIKQAVHSMAFDHFKTVLTDDTLASIQPLWDKIIDGDDLTADEWQTLQALDVSREQQDALVNQLKAHYPVDFQINPGLSNAVYRLFTYGEAGSHLTTLDMGAQINQLITRIPSELVPNNRVSNTPVYKGQVEDNTSPSVSADNEVASNHPTMAQDTQTTAPPKKLFDQFLDTMKLISTSLPLKEKKLRP